MAAEPDVFTEACADVTDTVCVDVCPVDAIYPADEAPAEMKDFVHTNRFVFADQTA